MALDALSRQEEGADRLKAIAARNGIGHRSPMCEPGMVNGFPVAKSLKGMIYEGIIGDVVELDAPEAPARGLYLRLRESKVEIIDLDILPHGRAWYEAHKGEKIRITCSWTPGEVPIVDVALI